MKDKFKKLNLGCGTDYREGWVNLDGNKKIKADVYADLNKKLPFKNDEFDYVLLDNVIEHIKRESFFKFMDELHRITKPNAVIDIYAPHCSGMYALQHPTHYNYFGIATFSMFELQDTFNAERHGKAIFHTEKMKLHLFHHNLQNLKFLSKLPINWIFNFNLNTQLFFEKFNLFGFDEIFYRLRTIK